MTYRSSPRVVYRCGRGHEHDARDVGRRCNDGVCGANCTKTTFDEEYDLWFIRERFECAITGEKK